MRKNFPKERKQINERDRMRNEKEKILLKK
jgi:hypothetical protein